MEPVEGATNEHLIYRTENLNLANGSCGHLNPSEIALENIAQSTQMFTNRVGRNYNSFISSCLVLN